MVNARLVDDNFAGARCATPMDAGEKAFERSTKETNHKQEQITLRCCVPSAIIEIEIACCSSMWFDGFIDVLPLALVVV